MAGSVPYPAILALPAVCLAIAGFAIVASIAALWRGRRGFLSAAAVACLAAIAIAMVAARAGGGHSDFTRVALGSGVVCGIALVIRFRLIGLPLVRPPPPPDDAPPHLEVDLSDRDRRR